MGTEFVVKCLGWIQAYDCHHFSAYHFATSHSNCIPVEMMSLEKKPCLLGTFVATDSKHVIFFFIIIYLFTTIRGLFSDGCLGLDA